MEATSRGGFAGAASLRASELFSPIRLGRTMVRNRIAMAPMTRGYALGGAPGENVADYYERRALGGVGLIFTEGAWIPHPAASNDASAPNFYGEDALAGWRRVREKVQAAGAAIVPQLWHVGLVHKRSPEDPRVAETLTQSHLMGPSGISGGVGVELFQAGAPMSLSDIDGVIDAFASAAQSAMVLGFDGAALHGAHGYIIDQFLWHKTNQRMDKYGGGHRDRATFAAEIVSEIRKRTAPDFPIVLRYSQWKQQDYDARLAETPSELESLLGPLVDAGVDLFDCSQRRFWEPTFKDSDLNLAGWTQKLTGRPSVTVGSVSLDKDFVTSLFGSDKRAAVCGIDRLLDMFERGDFDMVGVGRALISDPNWTEKIRQGRIEDLEPFSSRALERLL